VQETNPQRPFIAMPIGEFIGQDGGIMNASAIANQSAFSGLDSMTKAIRFVSLTAALVLASVSVASLAESAVGKRKSLRVPFSADEAFDTQFLFHSPLDVIDGLRSKPMPTKKEFETTDEFGTRQTTWESSSLFGNVTPNSVLAILFVPSPMGIFPTLEYDADKGLMTLRGQPKLCLEPQVKNEGSYTGTNAFGVKKVIRIVHLTQKCIDLDARSLDEFDASFPIERDKAKSLKANWALVVVGKLKSPYQYLDQTFHEPTISAPYKMTHLTINTYLDPTEFVVVNLTSRSEIIRLPKDKAVVLQESFRRQ
jgi:hypothetical protein